MPLTPDVSMDLPTVFSENLPSKTYKIDFNNNRIGGKIESLEAVKQAIALILKSRRYALENFSFDYGNEILNLIGKPRGFVESELERLVTEALLTDERIKKVSNFSINWDNDGETCRASFSVNTIFGDTEVNEKFYV